MKYRREKYAIFLYILKKIHDMGKKYGHTDEQGEKRSDENGPCREVFYHLHIRVYARFQHIHDALGRRIEKFETEDQPDDEKNSGSLRGRKREDKGEKDREKRQKKFDLEIPFVQEGVAYAADGVPYAFGKSLHIIFSIPHRLRLFHPAGET